MYPVNVPSRSQVEHIHKQEAKTELPDAIVDIVKALDSVPGIAVIKSACTLSEGGVIIRYAAISGTLEMRPIAEHRIKYSIPESKCSITRKWDKLLGDSDNSHAEYFIHMLSINWDNLKERDVLLDTFTTALRIAEAIAKDPLIAK